MTVDARAVRHVAIRGRWFRQWRQPRRLWSRFNPGLQVRLASGFGAVLVLALAANLLAERRVADVERQLLPPARAVPQSTRIAPPSRTVSPSLVLQVPDVASTTAAPEFEASLKAYARAVEVRRATGEPAVMMQLEAATETLQARSRQFQSAASTIPRAQRAGLREDLEALQTASIDAVALADRRRGAWRDYLVAVESLGAEVRQRLDGAWRIFGRVIARQQMVELRDRVEELRRRAVAAAGSDAVATQPLVEVEDAIAAVVDAPSKDAGVVRMQAALAAARSARTLLETIDSEERVALLARESMVAQLQQRVARMAAQIRNAAEAEKARAVATAQQATLPILAPEASPVSEESRADFGGAVMRRSRGRRDVACCCGSRSRCSRSR